jgi:hypothetical protein
MYQSDTGRRPSQAEPFNQLFQFGLETALLSPVTSPMASEPGKALLPVTGEPALEGA